jgi:low temperature requirement protein LtrA
VIAASDDPGALGRSAYHFVHPVMVAGIIVTAAADERFLAEAHRAPTASTLWLALGGTALFLAGQAMFKAVVWREVPWTRIAAMVLVGLAALPAAHLPAWSTALEALAVVVAVAVTDRVLHRPAAGDALPAAP